MLDIITLEIIRQHLEDQAFHTTTLVGCISIQIPGETGGYITIDVVGDHLTIQTNLIPTPKISASDLGFLATYHPTNLIASKTNLLNNGCTLNSIVSIDLKDPNSIQDLETTIKDLLNNA